MTKRGLKTHKPLRKRCCRRVVLPLETGVSFRNVPSVCKNNLNTSLRATVHESAVPWHAGKGYFRERRSVEREQSRLCYKKRWCVSSNWAQSQFRWLDTRLYAYVADISQVAKFYFCSWRHYAVYTNFIQGLLSIYCVLVTVIIEFFSSLLLSGTMGFAPAQIVRIDCNMLINNC